ELDGVLSHAQVLAYLTVAQPACAQQGYFSLAPRQLTQPLVVRGRGERRVACGGGAESLAGHLVGRQRLPFEPCRRGLLAQRCSGAGQRLVETGPLERDKWRAQPHTQAGRGTTQTEAAARSVLGHRNRRQAFQRGRGAPAVAHLQRQCQALLVQRARRTEIAPVDRDLAQELQRVRNGPPITSF